MTHRFIDADLAEVTEVPWGARAVLSSPSLTGAGQLVMLRVTLRPGGFHAFHRHPEQEEMLFVLEGTVEQWVGTERRVISGGDACFIPRDLPHASFNESDHDVRLLAVLGPAVGPTGHTMVDVSTDEPWASLR